MGAGGVIQQQRESLRTLATSSAIYDNLPPAAKARVDAIKTKALMDWTEDEDYFMRMVPMMAKPVA